MKRYTVEVITVKDHEADDKGAPLQDFKSRAQAERYARVQSLKAEVHECYLEVLEGDTEDELDRVNSFYYRGGVMTLEMCG